MAKAGRRRAVVALVAVLAVAASVAVVARVLAPAEVETVAHDPYPEAPAPTAGVIGRLPVAPLVVDGRLRVYAGARQVYADQPVTGRHRVTPFWSYRRWPAKLVGVLAEGTTVVSRWSDGKLVAVDARTGRVAWRAGGPAPGSLPKPRRTFAATVWDPAGLHVARTAGGLEVVLAAGPGAVGGYALADGRRLWHADVGRGCRVDVGSSASGEMVGVDNCAGPAAVELRDAATGVVRTRWRPPDAPDRLLVTPVGCRDGHSGCRGLRTAGPDGGNSRGWLVTDPGEPTAAPGLDGPESALDGERVVDTSGGVVTGRSPRTGEELWRRADIHPARVLATEPGLVHLLTDRRELVTIDPLTGTTRSEFVFTAGRDGIGWQPGRAYAVGGYVAVERVREHASPDDDDQGWFLMAEPVLLAAT